MDIEGILIIVLTVGAILKVFISDMDAMKDSDEDEQSNQKINKF